jgi:hypothetical protein
LPTISYFLALGFQFFSSWLIVLALAYIIPIFAVVVRRIFLDTAAATVIFIAPAD